MSQYGQITWLMPGCETSSSFQPLQKPSVDAVQDVWVRGVFRGGACFYGNPPSAVTKLIWITTRISLQIKGVSPQFLWEFGWYEKGPSLCQSPHEWQTVFVLFAALLSWACLCVADVDKCLGLARSWRSLRGGCETSCDVVCKPQKA